MVILEGEMRWGVVGHFDAGAIMALIGSSLSALDTIATYLRLLAAFWVSVLYLFGPGLPF